MNTQDNNIGAKLARAGAVIKLSSTFFGLLWWMVTCLGIWLVLFFLDNLLRLPAGLRLPLGLAGLALSLFSLASRILLPAARRQRPERTAVQLEGRYAVRDNMLINACQLEGRDLSPEERMFVSETVDASESAFSGIPLASLWRSDRLRKWGLYALGVVIAWAAYFGLLPQYAGNALARYALPLGDIPPVAAVMLSVHPDSDLTLCEGDTLVVQARLVSHGQAAPGSGHPPRIVWREGATSVSPAQDSGETADMRGDPADVRDYAYPFRLVRRSFAFRVLTEDTYSRSIRVEVQPLPKIKTSLFRITPPAYTAADTEECPGPPAVASGLRGSTLEIVVSMDRPISDAVWRVGEQDCQFKRDGDLWIARTPLEAPAAYELRVADPRTGREVIAAAGEIGIKADPPPKVAFLTSDRNRFVTPGTTLDLAVEASDEFGVRRVQVLSRLVDDALAATGEGEPPATEATPAGADELPTGETVLKTWAYLGPPGNPGPLTERLPLTLDPDRFRPGATYLLQALAHDFQPGGAPGRSLPIILRVKSWRDLSVPDADALAKAFGLLRDTIEKQEGALGLTDNLAVHLAEAVAGKRVGTHQAAMARQQAETQTKGKTAESEFRKHPDGVRCAGRLASLVSHEMDWVLKDIARMDATTEDPQAEALTQPLSATSERQRYILAELIALLGQVSSDRSDRDRERSDTLEEEESAPAITMDDAARQLKEDLKDFTRVQRRIIRASMTLMDRGPDDLTEDEEKILGELAREENKWARFFEEKLMDFSKLPLQDFADGSLAEEFNEVIQEIKLAAKSLYENAVELAVPQEQSGLEKAEELVQNLERWLPDTPDKQKWLMEEPPAPSDIPLAELPTELEDIVGELLDKEEEMTEDVEDVTSSWMDSIDKGAGWDATDGPISSMSAKGVTGNRLPNDMEIGGRSGEGRTGKSHGQMVEESAEGKEGRQTPNRLTPSPFEPGSVEDSSTEGTDGGTGGGKLSGFTEEGLRGPTPPPRLDKLARLADRQASIRQDAERLALTLRAYHLPTGDIELSIEAMKQLEDAAQANRGPGIRRAFSRVVDALDEARGAIRTEMGLHRETSTLPERTRNEIMIGLREGTPEGYEEMTAEYFRVLAEQGPSTEPTP